MTGRSHLRIVVISVLAGLLAFSISHTVSARLAPPLPPPWVNPNGTVDFSKMPACIPVVGRTGQPILNSKGQPYCVPREQLLTLPPPPPQPKVHGERPPVVLEEAVQAAPQTPILHDLP